MNFTTTINRVIELAKEAAAADERRHPSGRDLDFSEFVKSGLQVPPEHLVLGRYLDGLSQLELLALETIMYMGRDRDPATPEIAGVLADYSAVAQEPEARERSRETLLEKAPSLPEYLTRGLEVADAWGLPLEQFFLAALTPKLPPGQA